MYNTKIKKYLLILLSIFSLKQSHSQITFSEKNIQVNKFNHIFSSSFPAFADTSQFFKVLNRQIEEKYGGIQIDTTAGNEENLDILFPDSISINKEYERPEETTISYTIYRNDSKLLCFGVSSTWIAGGMGIGAGNTMDIYLIDVKAKKVLSTSDFFTPNNLIKVSVLFERKLSEQGLPYDLGTTFRELSVSDTQMTFYYDHYFSGSKMSTIGVDIPLSTLRKYMTMHGRILID
jgi:hypothetical protein